MTYAGSRSYDIEGNFGGYNEPSAAFQAQCDVTLGGSRSLCDQQLTNPFFSVPGFEGTTRFTSPTLSRFELARPFPAFSGCNIGQRQLLSMNQQNLGKMQYDSLQFVANKRWAKGVTINASYTWVPRWTEDGANTTTGISAAYVDEVSLLENDGPYFSHREHRITASGVWELPWYRDQQSIAGYLLGGWSIAPAFVYQSGQPWDMPGNVDLAPGVDLNDVALPGKKDGQFIYGVKPCVGQRNAATGRYDLLSVSTGVRLHRALLPDPRGVPAPHRDVPLRRVPPAVLLAGGRELREDDADHADTSGSRCVSRRSTSSTARCTTSATTTRPPRRPTSAASTATSRASRTSSGSSSWDSG